MIFKLHLTSYVCILYIYTRNIFLENGVSYETRTNERVYNNIYFYFVSSDTVKFSDRH